MSLTHAGGAAVNRRRCHKAVQNTMDKESTKNVDSLFSNGLHEFLQVSGLNVFVCDTKCIIISNCKVSVYHHTKRGIFHKFSEMKHLFLKPFNVNKWFSLYD